MNALRLVEVYALEGTEQLLQVILPDAYSCVLDGEGQLHPVVRPHFPGNSEGYCAVLRVLYGVVDEVHYDLADVVFIPVKVLGKRLVNINGKLKPLVVNNLIVALLNVLQHVPQVIIGVVEFHFAGLDFADVKDVVDYREEVIAGPPDVHRGLAD